MQEREEKKTSGIVATNENTCLTRKTEEGKWKAERERKRQSEQIVNMQ